MNRKIPSLELFLAAAVLLFARGAAAGSILDSPHDFSLAGWNTSQQICIVCHDQGNSAGLNGIVPGQWNHTLSSQTYALYSSPSLKASVGQPGMRSKLCLSCHDGTIAVDSFGSNVGGTQSVKSANNLGTTLRDDHPISFLYDTALANLNGTLFNPSAKSVTIGTAGTTKTGTIASILLFDGGQLECSSCHDVHNKYTVGTTGLLKVDASGSAICMACHNK